MAEPAGRPSWGVAALLLAVGDALQSRFGACSVRGELSGFARATSGHCYFTLKDADGAAATLRCAMFRRAATLLDFAPRDGQQVELRGRVAVYEPRGELQLVVESMRAFSRRASSTRRASGRSRPFPAPWASSRRSGPPPCAT